jgi:hypothetical protein
VTAGNGYSLNIGSRRKEEEGKAIGNMDKDS